MWETIAAVGGSVVSSLLGGSGRSAAKAASRAQARNLDKQTEILDDQYDFWDRVYKGLEESVAQKGMQAGSLQEQQEAKADAGALVEQAFKGQEGALQRQLITSGANPADPAFQSTMASMASQKAPVMAGAQYQAGKAVRDEALNKQMQIAGIGRNIPMQTASGYGSVASAMGDRASMLAQQARQDQVDIATAIKPVVDYAGGALKSWWDNNSAGRPGTYAGDGAGITGRTVYFAKGGIVDKPTNAVIGEAGTEAVLNPGALALLGEEAVNKLNRMGEMIARQGVRPPLHTMGAV